VVLNEPQHRGFAVANPRLHGTFCKRREVHTIKLMLPAAMHRVYKHIKNETWVPAEDLLSRAARHSSCRCGRNCKCPVALKIRFQSNRVGKRRNLTAERTGLRERAMQLGDKRCAGRALTQAVLSRSASPTNALYKSPQGECLPISSQGLGKLKNKNIPSPPLITLAEQQTENALQKPTEGSRV